MGRLYPALNEDLKLFIAEQRMFFVATAPNHGRINVSPKGMSTFRCLDDHAVAYLDLTGSGNETAAHLRENGRMTIMFCSFSEKPLILRLYGHGKVVRQQDEEWQALYSSFDPMPGARQIMVLQIDSVQTSCGQGVPLYEFKEERKGLVTWAEQIGDQGIRKYWEGNNQTSIDGLPTDLL